jgi:hypothetical protein
MSRAKAIRVFAVEIANVNEPLHNKNSTIPWSYPTGPAFQPYRIR